MRWTSLLSLLLLCAGCTSPYSVRVEGRVLGRPPADSPLTDPEPLENAVVSIAPRFGSSHEKVVLYSAPTDEQGSFRYTSSGEAREELWGVNIRATAPGFLPAEVFVPLDRKGRVESRDVELVLEDARIAR
jgi:hypothetical protein